MTGGALERTLAEGLLELSVDELLDAIADEARVPASGSIAALTAAMAAEIAGAAARRSKPAWKEAGGAAAQAHALRLRVAPLAQSDARAYEEAMELLERRAEAPPEQRDILLGRALERAAEIPLRIAQDAADVAALAAHVAVEGSLEARGDAAAAAALAQGASRAAAHLVEINLGVMPDDLRVQAALALADEAAEAAKRALRIDRH